MIDRTNQKTCWERNMKSHEVLKMTVDNERGCFKRHWSVLSICYKLIFNNFIGV